MQFILLLYEIKVLSGHLARISTWRIWATLRNNCDASFSSNPFNLIGYSYAPRPIREVITILLPWGILPTKLLILSSKIVSKLSINNNTLNSEKYSIISCILSSIDCDDKFPANWWLISPNNPIELVIAFSICFISLMLIWVVFDDTQIIISYKSDSSKISYATWSAKAVFPTPPSPTIDMVG